MNSWFPMFAGLAFSVTSAVIAGLFVHRKNKADAADIITQAAARVVQNLEAALIQAKNQTDALLAELGGVKAELTEMRIEVAVLRQMIHELGGDPNSWRHR